MCARPDTIRSFCPNGHHREAGRSSPGHRWRGSRSMAAFDFVLAGTEEASAMGRSESRRPSRRVRRRSWRGPSTTGSDDPAVRASGSMLRQPIRRRFVAPPGRLIVEHQLEIGDGRTIARRGCRGARAFGQTPCSQLCARENARLRSRTANRDSRPRSRLIGWTEAQRSWTAARCAVCPPEHLRA